MARQPSEMTATPPVSPSTASSTLKALHIQSSQSTWMTASMVAFPVHCSGSPNQTDTASATINRIVFPLADRALKSSNPPISQTATAPVTTLGESDAEVSETPSAAVIANTVPPTGGTFSAKRPERRARARAAGIRMRERRKEATIPGAGRAVSKLVSALDTLAGPSGRGGRFEVPDGADDLQHIIIRHRREHRKRDHLRPERFSHR